MAFSYSPKIVTDGLVLYLDAGNSLSYPGSGTTWTDLSRSRTNAVLNNGPTFSNGSIVFDGVDDYVNLPPYTINGYSYTYEVVGKFGNTSTYIMDHETPRIVLGVSPDGTGNMYTYNKIAYYPNGPSWEAFGTYPMGDNLFHIITYTIDNGTMKAYLDGVQSGNTANGASVYIGTSSTPVTLMSRYSVSNFKSGTLASFKIYNRALTSQEVQQNYNALKTRFGL